MLNKSILCRGLANLIERRIDTTRPSSMQQLPAANNNMIIMIIVVIIVAKYLRTFAESGSPPSTSLNAEAFALARSRPPGRIIRRVYADGREKKRESEREREREREREYVAERGYCEREGGGEREGY